VTTGLQLGLAEHQALLENAPDAMVIVDPDGLIVLVNAQTERLLGYSRDELIGRPVETLVPERLADRHSGHRAVFAADARPRAMGGQLELSALRSDGVEVPVEISLSPLRHDGLPLVSAAIRDVTERRRLHGLFRGVLESAPDAMVIVDARGVIQLINRQTEELFGFARHELVGRPVEMLVPERFRARHPRHREEFAASPRPRPMGAGLELWACRADGSEFPVEISLSPLTGTEQPMSCAAIRDVTDRRAVEAELRDHRERLEELVSERTNALAATNRELEAFSYTVSHDLRAPLRSIDGFGQALIEDHAGQLDEEGLEHLHRVRRASQRMATLLDGLLSLSRLTRADLKREPVDLSALAQEIADELAPDPSERVVTVDITPGIVVDADPRQVGVAMENLLGNAFKFTAATEDAHIVVEPGTLAGEPAVVVRDNGAGFDMAYADKLFGAFQRLHAEREFPGSGLGLATVQRIINRHGGRIEAEGHVGQGARFTFRFAP
jgi:PAS domain S-box-containing protein